MPVSIHPTAIVETDQLGPDVTIGEYAVIRKDVRLGKGVIVHPFVVIESGTEIGDDTEIFPYTYIGKVPKGAGATARVVQNLRRAVKVGHSCALGPSAVIFYDVEIGNNTLLGDGASVREQCRIGSRCIISRYVTLNYNTSIGDDTRIMDLTHITGNARVGNNVFISILVGTANDNTMVERKYVEEEIVGPAIADGVSVGMGALFLPGVRVGEGALVGSGAVVTKDVAPYDVVIGMPARKVRTLERR